MAFKVVAVGDSVVWGQGLRDEQKFHRLAAEKIARAIGEPDPPSVELYARSGAIISELPQDRPDDNGDYQTPLATSIPHWQEAPFATPTILQQVTPHDQRVFSDAEHKTFYGGRSPQAPFDPSGLMGTLYLSEDERGAVNLVIIDGGINDVNGSRILLGGNHAIMDLMGQQDLPTEALIAETRRNCYDEMKFLLKRTRESFPNAVIIVVGYHYVMSDESAIAYARAAVAAAIASLSPATASLAIVATPAAIRAYRGARRRGTLFHLKQLSALRQAVTEILAERLRKKNSAVEPGVYFAHPAFSARNATYGPESKIFQPPDLAQADWANDPTILAPNDPFAPQRDAQTCPALPPSYYSGWDRGTHAACKLAALFHPNVAGARRFADVIEETYLRNRKISLRYHAQKLLKRNSNLSLKEAFGRYNLLGETETSARDCLQHMIVDCLDVKIRTGDTGTMNKLSLRVGPGRTWHLNSIKTSGNLATEELAVLSPIDVFPNTPLEPDRTATFTIDPANGSPQNRLHLGDLEEITLRLDPGSLNPFDVSWEMTRVQLAVNGRTIFDQQVDDELRVDGNASNSKRLHLFA